MYGKNISKVGRSTSPQWDVTAEIFVCKYCKRAFRLPAELISHKKQSHNEQMRQERRERKKKLKLEGYLEKQSPATTTAEKTVQDENSSNEILTPPTHKKGDKITSDYSSVGPNTGEVQDTRALISTSSVSGTIPIPTPSQVQIISDQKSDSIATKEISTTLPTEDTHQQTNQMNSDPAKKVIKRKRSCRKQRYSPTAIKSKCPYCKKNFSSKACLQNHITIHTGEKPYQCPLCLDKFRRKDYLKFHELSEHIVFPCKDCSLSFSTASNLQMHIKTEHSLELELTSRDLIGAQNKSNNKSETNTFELPEDPTSPNFTSSRINLDCSVVAVESSNVGDVTSSTTEMNCSNKNSARSKASDYNAQSVVLGPGLRESRKGEPQGEDEEGKFRCQLCKKYFLKRRHLRRHEAREHKHTCNLCPQSFLAKKELKTHNVTNHNNEIPTTTASSFKRGSHLVRSNNKNKIHLQKKQVTEVQLVTHHTNSSNSNNLNNQDGKPKKRAVAVVPPLPVQNPKLSKVCTFCGKVFVSHWVRLSHEMIHTGERPFTCNHCGVSFRYNSNFIRHTKSQHSSVSASAQGLDDSKCPGYKNKKRKTGHTDDDGLKPSLKRTPSTTLAQTSVRALGTGPEPGQAISTSQNSDSTGQHLADIIEQDFTSGILQYRCTLCNRFFSYRTDAVKHARACSTVRK